MSLRSIVNMLLRNRNLVVGIVFLAVVVGALALLLLPRRYTGESFFMLQSCPNVPASLSALASQFGLRVPTGEANQSPAFYAELLQSRAILSTVVDRPITLRARSVDDGRQSGAAIFTKLVDLDRVRNEIRQGLIASIFAARAAARCYPSVDIQTIFSTRT